MYADGKGKYMHWLSLRHGNRGTAQSIFLHIFPSIYFIHFAHYWGHFLLGFYGFLNPLSFLLVNRTMTSVLPFALLLVKIARWLDFNRNHARTLNNNLIPRIHIDNFSCLLFNFPASFQKSGISLGNEPPFTSVGTGHLALRSAGLGSGEGLASFVVSQLP